MSSEKIFKLKGENINNFTFDFLPLEMSKKMD